MADESVLYAVLQAVADREGTAPAEVDAQLQEVVNPDVLDRLFTGGPGYVVFEFEGYEVTVTHEDEVSVQPSTGALSPDTA